MWPMLRQHGSAEWVTFHLPLHDHPRALETEIETADASEETSDRERPYDFTSRNLCDCATE